MFERINRVKCSYGNPANFPRSARESLYACPGVTGGGGADPRLSFLTRENNWKFYRFG